jgi:hypothetical protein
VLDAFNGDAIPVHLLTREALRLYLAKLSDDGLIALHISNDEKRSASAVTSPSSATGPMKPRNNSARRNPMDRDFRAT